MVKGQARTPGSGSQTRVCDRRRIDGARRRIGLGTFLILLAAGVLRATQTGIWTFPGGQTATTTSGGGVTSVSATITGGTWDTAAFTNEALGAGGAPNVFTPTTIYGANSWRFLVPALVSAGTVTFTFSNPVVNPVLHIDRLGGNSGGTNSSNWALASGGTLTKLSGTAHLNVTAGAFVGSVGQATSGTFSGDCRASASPQNGTACGSVRVNGTFTSLAFNVGMSGGVGVGDAVRLSITWEQDLGDAPASYGRAIHAVPVPAAGPFLGGVRPDDDPNGSEFSAGANSDDAGGADDEGIAFGPILVADADTSYTGSVTCSGTTTVAGWVDFNGNGTFDAGERAAAACSGGAASLTWSFAAPLTSRNTFARFRTATSASEVASPTGSASDGEVEDLPVTVNIRPRVVLRKTTVAIAGGPFGFTLTNTQQTAGSVTTTAAGTPTQVDGNTSVAGIQAFAVVSPGAAVTIAESTIPSGWSLSGASCVDGGGATVGSFSAGIYTIPGASTLVNATVTCTFTNPPSTDLQITKSNGVTTVTPGSAVTYTIVATNAGLLPAVGSLISDAIPATIAGATWTCSASVGSSCPASGSGDISASVDLLAGGTAAFTLTGTVSAGATGTLTNTASVSVPAGFSDPNAANNNATDTDTLTPAADLQVTKTNGATTLVPGTATTYTVVVTNAGPSGANGAIVADTPPATLTGVTWTCVAAGGAVCPAASGSGAINATVATFPASGSLTYSLTGTVAAGATGTLANTATVTAPGGVTDPTPANNSATDTDTLTPAADLQVTKTNGTTTLVPGTATTYTVVVTNAGPSGANGAIVADTPPATLTGVTWACVAAGGAVCPAGSGSGAINATVATFPTGGSLTYSLTGTVAAGATGTLANTATVTEPGGVTDPTPANNSATDTDTLTPAADLQVTKTNGTTSLVPGTATTYTVVVTNAGPSGANGAIVADTPPATLTGVTWTCVAAGGAVCPAGSGSGAINATVATFPASGSLTYSLTGTVAAGATGTLANTATVTAPGGVTDPTPANNSATDTDTLTPAADLQVTKTNGTTTLVPGTATTYTVVVTNAGPSGANGAIVADTPPATLTGVTWTCVAAGGAVCPAANGNGAINATVATFPAGGSLTYSLTGTVAAGATGTLANTATVTAPGGVTDPTPANNSATDTDTLTPAADLQVTKTNGTTTLVPGTATTYTVVVTSAGPSGANGAVVADTPPATLTGVAWTCVAAGGAVCPAANGNGAINATVATFPAGGSLTYSLTGTVAAGATGTLANTATVTAPGGVTDPTPANNSATDTDTLTPAADLQVTKTNGTTTLVPGTATTYTVVVTNAGPSGANGAIVADTPPATLTGVTWTCVAAGGAVCPAANGNGAINATVATFPAGGSLTYSLTGTVAAGATGTLANTATVTAPGGVTDPTPANNSATDTDTLTPAADLQVTKTNGTTTLVPGTATTYTVVVTSAGPSGANGAVVADTPPATLTGVAWTCVAAGGAVCPAANGNGAINATVATFPAGGSLTYSLTGTVAAGATGTLANTATVTAPGGVTDPTPANNSATDTDTLTPGADLSATKTSTPDPYVPGAGLTYTITVTNAGPSDVAGASVTDTVPAPLSAFTWTCTSPSGACGSGTGNIATTVTLASGQSATITLGGTVPSGTTGTLANTAIVTAPSGVTDPVPGNNSSTNTNPSNPTADLQVTKTNGTTTLVPGTATTYTIVARNVGPSDASNAVIADTPPATLTGVTWTCVAAGGAVCPAANGNGAINATVATFPAGGSLTYSLTGTVAAGATGTLANTATVTAPGGVTDPTPGNNSATDTDTLTPAADLSATKTSTPDPYVPGAGLTYTITVTNAGPSDVAGASVTDTVPAPLGAFTWTCTSPSGACGSGTGNIATTVTLAVGQSATITLSGTVPSGTTGTLANTAIVTAPSGVTDPVPGNNSSTNTNPSNPTADLQVTKTNGTTTLVPGTATTYTIVATNAGPSDASNAVITDTLPATLTGVTWTCVAAGGAVCPAASGSGAINATVATFPAGGSLTYSLTGTVAAGATGTLANTATVTAPGGVTDPTPGNNSATDTDTLTPAADLSATKTSTPDPYVPGAGLTYTITVTNAGPSDVAGASVTDTVPAPLGAFTWTCTSPSGACGSGTGDIATTVTLANGQSATITLGGTVPSGTTGTLANTAIVTAPSGVTDPVPGNNSSTNTNPSNPTADLQVTKTNGATTLVPGTATTYTIEARNVGPSDASNAVITDTPPATLTGVTWTCVAAGGAVCPAASGSGAINATVTTFPASGSLTYSLTGTVAAGATGTLANTATVTAPGGVTDPTPGNNSATDTDTLTPTADLSATKTSTPDPYVPGAGLTYTITVTNAGPSDVAGASVTDTVPAPLGAFTWTCTSPSGACGSGTGNIATTVTLASGQSATITLSGTVPSGTTGTLANTAIVTAPSGVTDPVPGNNSSTNTNPSNPTADLQVTKTSTPDPYVPGAGLTYTITVTNAGPSDVAGASVTDTVPAPLGAFTWTCTSPSGACGSGTGDIATTVTLANGQSATITLGGTVPSGTTGTLANTAIVTAPSGVTDPVPGNNSSTNTNPSNPTADLQVTKTSTPDPYVPGAGLTYTITVTNAGPSNVAGASVTDTVPAPLGAFTWTCTSPSGACGSGTGDIATTVTLANGQSATITLGGTVPSGTTGTLANTAIVTAPSGVTDPVPGNNSSTNTNPSNPTADLQVTKTSTPDPYVPGAGLTYTITVTNAGPSNVAGASVTDTVPAPLGAFTWTCTSPSGACGSGTGNIATTVTLANGQSATITLSGTVPSGTTGTLANTAIVTAPSGVTDPVPGNNSSTNTNPSNPTADLQVTKTSTPDPYVPGAGLTYTITVTNAGPSNVAGASVTDTVPAPLGAFTWTCTSPSGACGSGTGNIATTVTLAVGQSATITVSGTVPSGTTGTLANTAIVTAPSGVTDPVPGNNSSTNTNPSNPTADLQVTKTNSGTEMSPGQTTVYTVTVRNAGPAAVSGAIVSDAAPAGLTFTQWTCSATAGSSCPSSGTGNLTVPVSLLANGTATFLVTAQVAQSLPDRIVNTASVTAPAGISDPVLSNNSATDADAPVAQRIGVTKRAGTPSVVGPKTLEVPYAIAVTNPGAVPATNVQVFDSLSSAFADGGPSIALAGRVNAQPLPGTSAAQCAVNGGFTGVGAVPGSSTQLLAGSATLQPGQGCALALTVLVTYPSAAAVPKAPQRNLAVAEARGPGGSPTLATSSSTSDVLLAIPRVDITKSLTGVVQVGVEPTFDVSYRFVIRNTGSVPAPNVQIVDNLAETFAPGTPAITILSGPSLGSGDAALTIATTPSPFNGVTQTSMLTGSDTVAPGAQLEIALTVRLRYGTGADIPEGTDLPNTARATSSVTAGGTIISTDDSTDVTRSAADPAADDVAAATVVRLIPQARLTIDKLSSVSIVEVGDSVQYAVRVRNLGGPTLPATTVTDQLPLGFRYIPGSARLLSGLESSTPLADPAGGEGPALTFTIPAETSRDSVTVTYRVRVGVGADQGDGINYAQAVSGTTRSSVVSARVVVRGGVFTTDACVIGKIFADRNGNHLQDEKELGIPGVRLVLEDGTLLVSDVEGKYSYCGLTPTTHVLKVDRTTLPVGAVLTPSSNRNSGDAGSLFVDLKFGEVHRADFIEGSNDPAVLDQIMARRTLGEVWVPVFEEPQRPRVILRGRTANQTLPVPRGAFTMSGQIGAFAPPASVDQTGRPDTGAVAPGPGQRFVDLMPAGPLTPLNSNAADAKPLPLDESSRVVGQIDVTADRDDIPADGVQSVRLTVRLTDADGQPIQSPVAATVETSGGRLQLPGRRTDELGVDRGDVDRRAPATQIRVENGEATFELLAPAEAQDVSVRVTAGEAVAGAVVSFVPHLRPMVAVGVLEGMVSLTRMTGSAVEPVRADEAFDYEIRRFERSFDDGNGQYRRPRGAVPEGQGQGRRVADARL